MTAFELINKLIIGNEIFSLENRQHYCNCCYSYCECMPIGEVDLCAMCFFLSNKNANLFGKLTEKRDHSPISFLNSSLIVFEDHIDLLVSENYAKKIPKNSIVNVLTENSDDYLIDLLNEPKNCLFIKPSIKLEDYAKYLIPSNKDTVSICSPKGVIKIPVDSWNEFKILIANNDKQNACTALNIIKKVTLGYDLALMDKSFIKDNYIFMKKIGETLNINVHSKLFMIKLMLRLLSYET